MKQTLYKLTLIAMITTLTACSTNTRDQNTAVGAGTGAVVGGLAGSLAKGAGSGWVIAAGVVIGAIIGGVIGNSMDSTDSNHVNTAMNSNSIDQPENWTNDKTGVWYKIVPTSGMVAYKGNPNCRHYVAYGKMDGKTTKTHGLACRLENGMWHQVK
jgi:surface antigen